MIVKLELEEVRYIRVLPNYRWTVAGFMVVPAQGPH